MASSFELLPQELVVMILRQLDCADSANLRATSHTMLIRCTTDSFRNRFKTKNVHLSKESLEKFVQVTEHGGLGCLLENCTLTGFIRRSSYVPPRNSSSLLRDPNSRDRVSWAMSHYLTRIFDEHLNNNKPELFPLLRQAFFNLKKNTPTGSLASLSLQVQEEKNPESNLCILRTERFGTINRIFEMAIDALLETRLAVTDHLNIFGTQTSCSLQYDVFFKFMSQFFATDVFADLKKLTVSLMPRHQSAYQRFTSHVESNLSDFWINNASEMQNIKEMQRRIGQRTLQGIVLELPRFMPALHQLNFHWLHVTPSSVLGWAWDLDIGPFPSLPPLPNLAALQHSLQTVDLRGLFLDEEVLLGFLQLVQPRHVTLAATYLLSGSYAPVFDFLTSPESSVTSFHLDHLFLGEDDKSIHYIDPGHPDFWDPFDLGPCILTRSGCAAKEKIAIEVSDVWPAPDMEYEARSLRLRFQIRGITDFNEYEYDTETAYFWYPWNEE